MKRLVATFVLTLGCMTLALASGNSAHAQSIMGAGKVGVGVVAGPQFPIAQDDAGAGLAYGLRGRVGVLPMLVAEASVTWLNNGDGETDSGMALESPSATLYQVNALLKSSGIGFSMYLTGGLGWTSFDVPGGLGSQNETTFSAGIGAEMGLGPISVDFSPRLFVIQTEDGASRKNLGVLVGAHYYFN